MGSNDLVQLHTLTAEFQNSLAAFKRIFEETNENNSLKQKAEIYKESYQNLVLVAQGLFYDSDFLGTDQKMTRLRLELENTVANIRIYFEKKKILGHEATITDLLKSASLHITEFIEVSEKVRSAVSLVERDAKEYRKVNRDDFTHRFKQVEESRQILEQKAESLETKVIEITNHAEALYRISEQTSAELKSTVVQAVPEYKSHSMRVTIGTAIMTAMLSYSGLFYDQLKNWTFLPLLAALVGFVLMLWGLNGMEKIDRKREEYFENLFADYTKNEKRSERKDEGHWENFKKWFCKC